MSIASLLAFLKNDERYGSDFFVHHLPLNVFKFGNSISEIESFLSVFNIEKFDAVAISCYVWSEHLINPLTAKLRETGFRNRIILGGPQISYSDHVAEEYPDCQIFISGYAEQALLDAVLYSEAINTPLVFKNNTDLNAVPSVYKTGEIPVTHGQKMVRFETKRGCPYRCSFCAHRDLNGNRVQAYPKDRVYEELSLFKSRSVRKINVLDPVFNAGQDYLDILEEIRRIGLTSEVALQTRFEAIKGENGKAFLDLCAELNVRLEFGVQTIMEDEYKAIRRPNNVRMIKSLMKELNDRDISYEVSLIYGLPNQTFDSFRRSVDFLKSNGCGNLTAYPLMLLKRTELYAERKKWGFREKRMGKFGIPVVVRSDTFGEDEWYRMRKLAEGLNPNAKI
ncbi:radical SAM protein [Desulfococcaceae bacterium HSG8]|nr:radical SAM protein [Desulfococcaceae bacterium HSG8]